jgi:uncharacterized membrane protein
MKTVSIKSMKEAKKNYDDGMAINVVIHKFADTNDMAFTEAKTIILFVIGIVIFAALIPTALQTIHAANVTGWSTAETSLWNIFGLIVIGIAVYKLID